MISQLILRICLYISSTLGLQLYVISLVSLIFHIDVGIKIKSSLLNIQVFNDYPVSLHLKDVLYSFWKCFHA